MFLYQLGLARGGESPAQVLRGLRPSELGYYWALWHIDPWGEQRADLRSGILASLVANVNRDPKKTAPFKPVQFMPYHHVDERKANAALARRLLKAFGVTLDPKQIRRKKKD